MPVQITNKMKEALLESLPRRYKVSKSLSPILEYDFYSIDSWFLDNIPMLRIPDTPQHYLQQTLNHLESDGHIDSNKSKMTFRLTKEGLNHINPIQPEPNPYRHTNWQDNKVKYIVIGIFIVVVGGYILHSITS